MEVFRELRDLPVPFGPTVATIGNFDGVHCGHQHVIASVIARARELRARSAVLTFDPHPSRAIRPETNCPLITPLSLKLELLAETGVDVAVVLPFTPELARLSAEAFATRILAEAMGVVELHEGENFRFGYGASADVAALAELGRGLGFGVRTYPPELRGGEPISSSRIRDLIRRGEVARARQLLGRSFAVESHPASGRGYGMRYAVPTINLAPYPELLPANGVYVTMLAVGAGEAAERFEGVTNVGNRPTFGADSFAVESHLLKFHPIELSESTPLRLTFLHHLREERQWPSTEALRVQIGRDVAAAQRFFSLCRALTR